MPSSLLSSDASLLLPEKATVAYLEALKIAESLSAKRYVAMSASLLCAVSVFAEDWELAASYAMRALTARDPHEVIFAETPRWPETAALLHAGNGELAAKDLHHFREHFGANKRCSLALACAQAVLAKAQGESQQVIGHLQTAIAEAVAIGLPGEVWQTEVALAKLYFACEEHEQAEQTLSRAASTIQQLASNITNDEMRAHFLAQAHAILSSARKRFSY